MSTIKLILEGMIVKIILYSTPFEFNNNFYHFHRKNKKTISIFRVPIKSTIKVKPEIEKPNFTTVCRFYLFLSFFFFSFRILITSNITKLY